MTILEELLDSLKKSDVDEQLRIICDVITKEEILEPDKYEGPVGANIFLSLNVLCEKSKKYENYICLEREAQKQYIISHWTCLKNSSTQTPKRVKAWEVKQHLPKKIMEEFSEKMVFLKGE